MNLTLIPPHVRLWAALGAVAAIATLIALLAVEKANGRADKAALVAAAERFDRFAADVRVNTALAHANDQANARRVEAAQSHATQEVSRDLETKLADARRSAADYADRLRRATGGGGTGQGGGGTADVPRAAGPAGTAASAGGGAQLANDLRICSENTVKLKGWQEWWQRVEAVPR